MELFRKENIIVRTIEKRDKYNYLKLYIGEDFCSPVKNTNLSAKLHLESWVVDQVINNNHPEEQIIIIEDNDIFIGYAALCKREKDVVGVGMFAINKKYRNKGYSIILLDIIKSIALVEKSDLVLECLYGQDNFFTRNGMYHEGGFHYSLSLPQNNSIDLVPTPFKSDCLEKTNYKQHKEKTLSYDI